MAEKEQATKQLLLRQLAAIEREEEKQRCAKRAAQRAQIKAAAKTRAQLMKRANYRPLEDLYNQTREVKDRLWHEMPEALTAGVSRALELERCVDYACGCMSAYFVNFDENCMGLLRRPDLSNEERHIHCAEHDQTAAVAAIDAQLAAVTTQLAALEAQKRALHESREKLQQQRAETIRSGAAGTAPAVPSRFPWNNEQVYLDLCRQQGGV